MFSIKLKTYMHLNQHYIFYKYTPVFKDIFQTHSHGHLWQQGEEELDWV